MNTTIDRSPTDPATVGMIEKCLEEMLECLLRLRDRWTDEKGYENIEDYFKVICEKTKAVLPTADDIKASKWMVTFKLPNNRWYAYYLKGGNGGWKRVK